MRGFGHEAASQKRVSIRQIYPGLRGYGDESDNTVVELTYNWETHKYDIGNAFGHLALGVDDIYKTCDDLRSRGAKIVREPGPMAHGSTHIAFIEDPNGYKIELIDLTRRAPRTEK